jgi:hypothetical protein
MGPVNGVNSVVDCGVHDRKATGWMDGCRLRAKRPHNSRSVLFHWTTGLTD